MKYQIGSKIRQYRESCGLSQKELADKLKVSNSRVSNWEQGINRPDADMIGAICVALGVSPTDLLDIKIFGDELSSHEMKVIEAYREKSELRHAINILLGIDDE